MPYRLSVAEAVAKQMRRLPAEESRRILEALRALTQEPRPFGSIKVKGRSFYRLRVGNYRVLYEVDDSILQVTVWRVQHRKDVYRDMDNL